LLGSTVLVKRALNQSGGFGFKIQQSMSNSNQLARTTLPADSAVITASENWTIHEYPVVTSTNLIAAGLPAWHAVRAETQTNGRGRFQRNWISDQGGLWLSAVVPCSQDPLARRTLPMAAGLVIRDCLYELGVRGIRLRWPNDVLVQDRKLAGLLIDQFEANLAVVGIGINVTNRPEVKEAGLAGLTTRLADLMSVPPDLGTLATLVLRQLRYVLAELEEKGAAALLARINALWGPSREIELDLDGTVCRGAFKGVDAQGRLALAHKSGRLTFYDAHEVRHLTET
jgi:BirA family biotin operon repressor/biotin-[acetyl-CoA-carboxylase] ligase